MAKITEFHIGCSKLIALPNYQNIRIEASITVSMDDPNESLDHASGYAQEQLRQLLEETYKAQYKHAKALI